MAPDPSNADAPGCPVDHQARAAWLQQSQKAAQDAPTADPPTAPPAPRRRSPWLSLLPFSSQQPSQAAAPTLGTDREISTIPRAQASPAGLDGPTTTTATSARATASHGQAARPANNENESGADQRSGNWIYPSEEMFFNAMRRKNHDPQAADMRAIVPIHNAVNERAWKEIRDWEQGQGSEACGGPKLVSFSGDSSALTPRARWNSFMGYSKPFDRHDWVVDRCGQRIEYVIDFYAGRDEKRPGKSLNFYLDVRPKLNSWEGARMRMSRVLGL